MDWAFKTYSSWIDHVKSIRPYLCAGYFFGETSIGHSFVGGGDYPGIKVSRVAWRRFSYRNGKYVLRKFILVKVGILI
jgi:hypothetical protein